MRRPDRSDYKIATVTAQPPVDDDLQSRAARVRGLLPDPSDRPLFVEFAGTPKSGKSSCIENVTHFFRRCGFRVLAPTEGASKRTPYYLKDDLTAFNTWSAAYALSHILEARYHADRYDLAVLDRGLFDSLVWFDLLREQGELSEEVCGTIQDFLQVDLWRSLIDVVFMFVVDPDEAMHRENNGKLIRKHGRAMNPEFLSIFNHALVRVQGQFADQFETFVQIDTSKGGYSAYDAAKTVADVILAKFEAKLE